MLSRIRFQKKTRNNKLMPMIGGVSILVILGMQIWLMILVFTIFRDTHRTQRTILEGLEAMEASLYAGMEEAIAASILARMEEQTRVLVETSEGLGGTLEGVIEERVNSSTRLTGSRINETNGMIAEIGGVYAALLEEQKKKTVESLFSEEESAGRIQRGEELMEAGKYHQANEEFTILVTAEPWNDEARFYMLYSLFLSNRTDWKQYRGIREGFALLNRNGYMREEMSEALGFMDEEERGIAVDEEQER